MAFIYAVVGARAVWAQNGVVEGTAGNDTMAVGYTDADGDQITNGNDVIDAGAGVDTIRGGNGADVITADDGDDIFLTYYDESFGDTLNGGNGIDKFGTYIDTTSTDYRYDVWLNSATTLNSIEVIDGSIPAGRDKELRLTGVGTFDLSSVTTFLDITDVYSHATTGALTLLLPNLISTDRFFLDDGADIDATIGTVTNAKVTISTGIGSDNITTGAGNDIINGGHSGTDVINAGEGFNTITTSSGSDTVTAGNGGNTVSTGNHNDTITTGTGVDTIRGGNGVDVITADDGDDIFMTYYHESLGDTLNGGNGIDKFGTYIDTTSTDSKYDVWLNSATTLNSIEVIDGSIPAGADKELRLTGVGTFDLSSVTTFLDITDVYSHATTGALTLLLPNLISTDRFFLDDGADIDATIGTVTNAKVTISTGIGSDNITTGAGNDIINGGHSGTDVINAGEGFNTITTSSGSDTVTAGNGGNTISTGNHNDTITTGTGVDTIRGGNGVDVITADDGDDIFLTYYDESFGDTLNGGNGIDKFGTYIDTTSTDSKYDVWLNSATTLNSIEVIDGSIPAGRDKELRLTGVGTFDLSSVTTFLDITDVYSHATTGALTLLLPNLISTDRFFLDDGADIDATIGTVTNAKVTISTGIGSDNITTGAGNDIINGGHSGTDVINAGEGFNTITTSSGSDTVTAGNGGNTISTGNHNDTITTGTGVDTIRGGNGVDVITADDGDDIFLTYYDESFGDTLNGGNGIDKFGTYIDTTSTDYRYDVWLNSATTLNSIEVIDGSIPAGRDKELRLTGVGTFDLSSVTTFLDITDVYSHATTGALTLLLPNLISTDRFFLDDGADVTVEIATNTVSGSAHIYLGSGNDRVTGGPGNDILYLGSGTDTVVLYDGFNSGLGDDNIYNFSAGGSDELDVSLLTDSGGGTITADEVISVSVSSGASTRLIFPNGEQLVLHNVAYASMDETSEIALLLVDNGSPANPMIVTSTADTNTFGTLRYAINHANANTGDDIITFAIPGAASDVHTITLTGNLPDITDDGVSIDGTTQGDATCGNLWAGTPHTIRVRISGGSVAMESSAQGTFIKGLSITNSTNALIFQSSASNAILQCSYLGIAPDGTAAGNAIAGVWTEGDNTQIGGVAAGEGNVIGSNSVGIMTSTATNVSIRGNFIGTDPTGTSARANTDQGISNNSGTTSVNEIRRNLISGNKDGIQLQSNDTWTGVGGAALKIVGNYIGTDRTGLLPVPNTRDGIAFSNGTVTGLTIGGTGTNDGNIISGNGENGVELNAQSGVTLLRNYIGVGVNGTTAIGNGHRGIWAADVSDVTIGSVTSGLGNLILNNTYSGLLVSNTSSDVEVSGNTIAANDIHGVEVWVTSSVAIFANEIYDNTLLGIDLQGGTEDANGVSANDNLDGDTGPNDVLNFPVINSLVVDGTISVFYDFNLDVPSATNGYRIDFFKNTSADLSGHGEGEIFLGYVDIAHTGGDLNFTGSFTASETVGVSDVISSTATRKTGPASYDITSEFSLNFSATTLSTDLVVVNDVAVFDPLNQGLYSIPGHDVIRTLNITNAGGAPTSTDTIILIVNVAENMEFYNGDIDDGGPEMNPVAFEQSTSGSLSFTYSTDVAFSNSVIKPNVMTDCNYSPSSGYDSAVTFICLNPKGQLMSGNPNPFVALSYRARIK